MTEEEWLACAEPIAMLECLDSASSRKLRLFACACCRRIWHLLADEPSRNAVEIAEKYVDGSATDDEREGMLAIANEALLKMNQGSQSDWRIVAADAALATVLPERSDLRGTPAAEASNGAAAAVADAHDPAADEAVREIVYLQERAAQADLVRCIFGHPVRRPVVDPAWLSRNDNAVVMQAQRIYDERRFDELPILADLLEQAGCDNREMLEHCRSHSPHVRGCWVLDALLGRSTGTERETYKSLSEAEWLCSTGPDPMLEFVQRQVSDRKLRLFACACCRRIWHLSEDEHSRRAVEIAESYADGLADEVQLNGCRNEVRAQDGLFCMAARRAAEAKLARENTALRRPSAVRACILHPMMAVIWNGGNGELERQAQANLLRDVLGNPFHSLSVPPTCLTPPVVAHAQAAYDERDLPSGHLHAKRLAILADALEESGCTNEDVLAHLRGPGPHVRGCWVVDLLLGRE